MSDPVTFGRPGRRYTTDDCDQPDEEGVMVLDVSQGENGDWYLMILPEGHSFSRYTVRLTTSGQKRPGLVMALAKLYEALGKESTEPF